jgi:hypothetical protein
MQGSGGGGIGSGVSLAGSNLARFYLLNLKKIAAKLVMRMSATIRRRAAHRPAVCDGRYR